MDDLQFRDLLGRFASGVTVVTTIDATGRAHGMTVSAFCSVSLVPPLVLFCIDRAATMRDLFANGQPYVINILADDQSTLSERFSQLDMELRFDGVLVTSGTTSAPRIVGASATLDCEVVARYDGGDHDIVLGRVLDGNALDSSPLVYYRGAYHRMQ